MQSILLVEDDALARSTFYKFLEVAGYIVIEAPNGQRALEICQIISVDMVVTDIIMPVMEGVTLIRELKARYPDLKVLAITGGGTFLNGKSRYSEAVKAVGADEVLLKPVTEFEFIKTVQNHLTAEAANHC